MNAMISLDDNERDLLVYGLAQTMLFDCGTVADPDDDDDLNEDQLLARALVARLRDV